MNVRLAYLDAIQGDKHWREAYLPASEVTRAEGEGGGVGGRSILDTGVPGVQANVEVRDQGDRIRIRVRQKLSTGEVKVLVGTRALSQLTQSWLDRKLCEAAALRWHVQNVSLFGDLSRPLTVKDLPRSVIPIVPVKRLSVSDVVSVAGSVGR